MNAVEDLFATRFQALPQLGAQAGGAPDERRPGISVDAQKELRAE